MNRVPPETRGLKVALSSYSFLVILQTVVYLLTNMLVIFANALEMLSDILVSAFLLLSVYWSRKPPDESYMFGHERAQNVGALVSGTILIFFMSAETFRQAIPKLLESSQPDFQNVSWAIVVILVGMSIIALPILDIARVKSRGASLKAQLVALLKDELTYVVTLAAILLVAGGYYMADAYATLFVGALIAFSGLFLFRDNIQYLAGRAPGKDFLAKVTNSVMSVKGVLGMHDLRAEYVGPGMIHAGFHIEVARGTTIEDANRISSQVEAEVAKVADCQYCIIHVDPEVRADDAKRTVA